MERCYDDKREYSGELTTVGQSGKVCIHLENKGGNLMGKTSGDTAVIVALPFLLSLTYK